MTTPDPDLAATVNDWVNVVRRSRLDPTTKLIALLMASYASPDGTNIFPGVARLAIQARCSYRTVQLKLARLRAVGLIEQLPRIGLPRGFASPHRLILGPDALEKAQVPSPATEEAAIDQLKIRYRGRHRAKESAGNLGGDDGGKSARNLDDVQNGDCTQWDGTTARNGQPADLQEVHATLHRPLPVSNPPYITADVVARGTGSTRASGNDNPDISSGEVNGQPPATRRPAGHWRDPQAQAARQAAEARAARLTREATP